MKKQNKTVYPDGFNEDNKAVYDQAYYAGYNDGYNSGYDVGFKLPRNKIGEKMDLLIDLLSTMVVGRRYNHMQCRTVLLMMCELNEKNMTFPLESWRFRIKRDNITNCGQQPNTDLTNDTVTYPEI